MAKRRRYFERKATDVHDIESFCRSNGISRTTYFALRRQGKAPREIRLGKRIVISPEAEADWRRDREND